MLKNQNHNGVSRKSLRLCVVVGVIALTLGAITWPAKAVGGYKVVGTGGAGLNVRNGPGTGYPKIGWVGEGSAIDIACQIRSSSSVNGSTMWDRLNSPYGGGYISDYYTTTPVYNDYSPGLPHCDQLPATGSSGSSSVPQGKVSYANRSNTDIAARYIGGPGENACRDAGTPSPSGLQGTCKQFVNCVVRMSTGGAVWLAPGYYSKYAQYGVQVSASQAARGDIIQLAGAPGDDSFHNGMHTAFVVSYLGGENFDVVYSNYSNDRRVHHVTWNPFAQARSWGLNVYIWRLGRV